jgi:5-methylcytosine-specific restriction endonuclease McrA
MLRPCLTCGRLSTGSRCELHRRRPNDPRRGSGAARRFRAAALRKTGGRCARCGSREGVEAHHRVPLADGGTNAPEQAVPLCHACHLEVTR